LRELRPEPLQQHRATRGIVVQEANVTSPGRSLKQPSFAIGLCKTNNRYLERSLGPVVGDCLRDIGFRCIRKRPANPNAPIGLEPTNDVRQISSPSLSCFALRSEISQDFVAQLNTFTHEALYRVYRTPG